MISVIKRSQRKFQERFITIPKGSFLFGEEKVKTEVDSFAIYNVPVTQELYEATMGVNPSKFQGVKKPVEQVNWFDTQEFLKKLNELTGKEFRLLTEKEWEYACRAGSTTEYFWGNDVKEAKDYAWYNQNNERSTCEVGLKKPNSWGLYDMAGNVWEWCSDWCDEEKEYKVLRGGGWDFSDGLRSANRYDFNPSYSDGDVGFRVASRPFEFSESYTFPFDDLRIMNTLDKKSW